ncbi:MAG: EcoRV family type II restriction endonuclease [Bacteroidetes bacterium]|nr:EcoRV family type II restriction endonuclease [Bacteroidota bacterium]
MNKYEFLEILQEQTTHFNDAVELSNGDWIVKGFIDVSKNIYTISVDTKVISKVMELILFPEFVKFAEKNNLQLELARQQNFYPDISFKDADDNWFAVDLKTTVRQSANRINSMTLGAFTGYFRERTSTKNCNIPYGKYKGHFVLGAVYSQVEGINERVIYKVEDLQNIASVIKDFQFFAQEKYKIASETPGSGNTKNIGSIKDIGKLLDGQGPFTELGEEVFDDYWMYYLTTDMAKAAELSKPPYNNLRTYKKYKEIGS